MGESTEEEPASGRASELSEIASSLTLKRME